MATSRKGEQLWGIGACDLDDVLDCSSGTGLGESHSWGRCAPMTHQVPGPSVIASTSRRSDDAPPEGRPRELRHKIAESVSDMKMGTSSIGGEADMCAGGGSSQEVIKREDIRARAIVMELGSNDDDIKARGIAREQSGTASTCISSVNKCKGKYRIKMKGPACHGQACCRGI